MSPLISVIIPTYNYANYITEAINSVLQQDYAKDKMEIIVVDDGSVDNTKEVLKDFIQANMVKYYYQENKGKAGATYKAIQQATGKYIFNLDADDFFLPGKIKQTVEVFESDENIVHVASPARFFEQDNHNLKGAEDLPAEILGVKIEGMKLLRYFYRNNILYGGGSTFAARASVLKQIIIPLGVDMFTDEFLILAVLPWGKSYFFKQAFSIWRAHGDNYSRSTKEDMQQKVKALRLLKSSVAVLNYLKQNRFDKSLIKIYTLKDKNRQIAYKEVERTKSLRDIFKYAKEVFFTIRPDWRIVKNYQVLNRLIPLPFYFFIKKITR